MRMTLSACMVIACGCVEPPTEGVPGDGSLEGLDDDYSVLSGTAGAAPLYAHPAPDPGGDDSLLEVPGDEAGSTATAMRRPPTGTGEDTVASEELTEGPLQSVTPSFEEFRDAARFEILGREVFLVETDMVIEGEADLREYYGLYVSGTLDKAIVNRTLVYSGHGSIFYNVWDIRDDGDPSTPTTDISYCFDNSAWGGDSDGDDNPNEALPTQDSVLQELRRGMAAWEGVANVRFVYDSGNDGSGCASSDSDLTVTLDFESNCVASGSFPSMSTQMITIPICGLPGHLAHHELGHVLGFRHEHIHSNDPNRCSEDDGNYEELFASYDPDSTMIYDNCRNDDDLSIADNNVSAMDAVAARMLYGQPNWWWSGLL